MKRVICIFLLLPIYLSSQSLQKSSYNKQFAPSLFSIYDTAMEKQLFVRLLETTKTNKRFDYLDSGLIASGANSLQKLQSLKTKYNRFLVKIKNKISNSSLSPYIRARAILKSLFRHFLYKYQIERTTVIDALEQKKFNCVSASYLFNMTALRFGFRVRAMAVPGHVYSQVKLNNRWIDVETTSKNGFDPYRYKYQVVRNSGRYYIEDKGQGKTHTPVSTKNLTALIFYNRGTLLLSRNMPKQAAKLFIKALKILPSHFESSANLMTSYIRWCKQTIAHGKTELSLKICREAITALGRQQQFLLLTENVYYEGAKNLADNKKYSEAITLLQKMNNDLPHKKQDVEKNIQGYYARWAQHMLKQNQFSKMMEIINSANKKWKSRFIRSFKVHLATQAAQKLFQSRSPNNAISFYNKHIPIRNESTIARNNRQFLYNRFGQILLSQAKFEQAYLTFSSGSKIYPTAHSFKNNKLYAIQRWVRNISTSGNRNQIITVMYRMYQKYKEPAFLKSLVNNSIREAHTLQRQGRYSDAEKILIRIAGIKPFQITAQSKKTLYYILYNWGVSYARKQDYDAAIKIFIRALSYFPKDRKFRRLLKLSYYNLAIYFINTRQYTQARIVVQQGLRRFPKNQNLQRLLNHLTN